MLSTVGKWLVAVELVSLVTGVIFLPLRLLLADLAAIGVAVAIGMAAYAFAARRTRLMYEPTCCTACSQSAARQVPHGTPGDVIDPRD